ncbi:hypothetical protein [Polynucleobacter sp.]|uniref:hypothetical protein n=1 Tax=Polynucleobacter sp. TaxID=2029855 RepID=UPI003F6A52FE
MSSIANVRIGPCSVTYGGVNLGHTKDGATLKIDRKFKELNVDQYGNSPVDLALTGNEMTIVVSLAEPEVDNLNVGVPEADYAAGSGGERLGIGTDAGYSLRTDAKLLVLHPLKNGASDLSEDINIYKAVSSEPVELPFKVDEQRVFKVTFRALVDETYGSGRRLGHIGVTNIS